MDLLFPQAELRKDDRVSNIWSALRGFESIYSDSGDKQCLRPTRTQAVKGGKDKPPVTVITHKSASPKQLDEWSKTLKHPRDRGMMMWDPVSLLAHHHLHIYHSSVNAKL